MIRSGRYSGNENSSRSMLLRGFARAGRIALGVVVGAVVGVNCASFVDSFIATADNMPGIPVMKGGWRAAEPIVSGVQGVLTGSFESPLSSDRYSSFSVASVTHKIVGGRFGPQAAQDVVAAYTLLGMPGIAAASVSVGFMEGLAVAVSGEPYRNDAPCPKKAAALTPSGS